MPTSAPAKQPLHLRVFLASPGDVNDERQLALMVLNQLPYDPLLRGRVTFEAVAWDHPQAEATMWAGISAQDSVIRSLGKPADCDIVVIILWSRLGSPIAQPDYAKPDGGFYTGTEWEYYNAMEAFQASGRQRPPVLVYHRTEEPVVKASPKGKQAYNDLVANMEQVEDFLKACRIRDGSIPNAYETPSGFAEALEQHLKAIVRQRLASLAMQPAQTDSVSKTESVSNHDPLWVGSPFHGLRPFTNKDAPIFFGRGRETDELLARLHDPKHRFIAVVGASGSGKSSLVWAGLIPRLLGGALEGSADWACVRFTPGGWGDNPFISLAGCWKDALENEGQSIPEFADQLLLAPERLDGLMRFGLANRPETAELLLFIDQFEELFTVVKDDCRQAFVRFVLAASGSSKVRVIVSLRADFYAQCVEQGLAEVLRTGSYLLAAPGPGALYQMLTRPAALAGLAFEQGLDEAILNDAGQEPGALPLLAFVLERLYQQRTAEGVLTYVAYKSIGSFQGAIGQYAERTYKSLQSEAQAVFGLVFRELVEIQQGGFLRGHAASLASIQVSVAAEQFIYRFINARLFILESSDNQAVVKIAHEALFTAWPRLQDWVLSMKMDLQLLKELRASASDWEQSGRRKDYLLPSSRMVILREMVQRLNPVMHEAEGLFIQLDFDSADFSSSKVFICYAREDEALTRNLYNRLLRDGFQPWLDKEDILPGQDWESEIKKAVKKCDYILVCLSKSSISKTGFVQKEIRLALDVADTQPDGSIFLIPIRLEEIDIPERLSQLQWVNYFDNEGYGRLITALHCGRSHLQKK